ncbi:MAG: hypothetical protein M1828_004800 [Chrysothrix sp. TS-e1954]|nr:MAG: hypothetical protein M1828_004800 [Chrysothrix sp. TS-e1954]
MESGLDPAKTPSGRPPPGVKPNFSDPTSQAPIVTVFVTVSLALMLLVVALRLHADFGNFRKLERAGCQCSDDPEMLIGDTGMKSEPLTVLARGFADRRGTSYTLASIAYCAFLYDTISQGSLGRHIWDVPLSKTSDSSVRNFQLLVIVYGPVEFLAKLSVLMLYLRIFGIRQRTRILTYVAIAISLSRCLLYVIGYTILCVPAGDQSWVAVEASRKCSVTGEVLGVVAVTISIVNDFFIMSIPLPAVWDLKLATKKKIGLSAVFITGLLVCITGILNLVYRIRLWKSREDDATWNGAISYMLNAVEANVAIICGCLPSLASYVTGHRRFFHSLGSYIRLGSMPFRNYARSATSKRSSREGLVAPDRVVSHDPLTLGSAIKHDGRFLKTADQSQAARSHYPSGGQYDVQLSGRRAEGTTLLEANGGELEMQTGLKQAVSNSVEIHPGSML